MDSFNSPKGMRDFYPEDFRAREALFNAWRATAATYGFEMYDACVVESLDLLERKAGEEISEQIYAFKDKSDNRLALRAEMTPTLARMIIARQGGLSFPVKWSAIAQCFRYERMQRGRKREHYQLNLDIIGEPSVMAEAEVIGAAVNALRNLGLTAQDFKVRVGSRRLLNAWFKELKSNDQEFAAICLGLDKRGKISDDEIRDLLRKEGLGEAIIDAAFTWMSYKGTAGLEAVAKALAGASEELLAALGEILGLFKLAGDLGFAEFLEFDLSVIRGLGYYTGIVFEAFDTAGKFRAIFGGGRYDSLLSALGGEKMPCVGLGFGDVVVMELLAELGKAPQTKRALDAAVGFMTPGAAPLALKVAARLRGQGQAVDLGLKPEKAKKFFDRANKNGAARAVYIGPDEAAHGVFTVKDMNGGPALETTLEALGAPEPPQAPDAE